MESNRIFIGNVYKHDEVQKENVVLVQARNQKYLELNKTKSILNLLALEFAFLQNESFLSRIDEGAEYVKEESLKPYVSVPTDIDLKRARFVHKKK